MKYKILKSVCIAFSTYTSIPMPRVDWDNSAARLALGFFPLPGVVIGAALFGWYSLCGLLGVGDILFAAVAAAMPVLITGGIHLDGFCDTVDALSSRRERESKLEILKDPNAGAFAVIYCGLYLLLCLGLFAQSRGSCVVVSFGYVLSRALAAVNAVTLPGARGNGMLAAFTKNSPKPAIISLNALFCVFSCAGMLYFGFYQGFAAIALSIAAVIWYRRMALKQFGGATGDTSGFYLQITELLILFGVTAGGFIT